MFYCCYCCSFKHIGGGGSTRLCLAIHDRGAFPAYGGRGETSILQVLGVNDIACLMIVFLLRVVMRYDVFVSYSTVDQKVAEGVCGYLERYGLRCFVAYRDIAPGRVWAAEITKALDDSASMVVIFSEAFNVSEQTDREIELASENKIPILTFRVADTKFTGAKKYYLKNLNWIDAFPEPDAAFGTLYTNLCRLLNVQPQQQPKPQPATTTMPARPTFRNETYTVNGVSFTMVAVEGGTFRMGATAEQGSDASDDEKPAHEVTLDDYWIGETVVTEGLWTAVMGSNPSEYKRGDDYPVENVSWDDCQTFIGKLNEELRRQGYAVTFRLPTEAEWEYAARGGKKSARQYKYSGSDNIDEVAWYEDNSDWDKLPVKRKAANALGLYDMSGNVWEWCQDCYASDYYSRSPSKNPKGPAFTTGSYRVGRGGSWSDGARNCRVSYRYDFAPSFRNNDQGLRLAR